MVLELNNISRSYKSAYQNLQILRGAELKLKAGECVALVGPSGVGKTTLLQIAGLLDKPNAGVVKVCGQETNQLNDTQRSIVRNNNLGFVFQNHMLMAEFTALENVMMPMIINRESRKLANKSATMMLEAVGLAQRLHHRPATLSGGEQQRVAVARALVNQPKVLIADEPTGNLDVQTTESVFSLILQLVRDKQVSALIATHSSSLAQQMDRVITLKEGQVVPIKL